MRLDIALQLCLLLLHGLDSLPADQPVKLAVCNLAQGFSDVTLLALKYT
jgi:hypothetical protein